jgi:hypothetical protein
MDAIIHGIACDSKHFPNASQNRRSIFIWRAVALALGQRQTR